MWPGALGLSPALGSPAAIVLLSLGLWATGALPYHLTALLLFLLAMALDVAPPAVIFAGFGSSALWLVFGGLVIGSAVQTTGLGRRLARLVVDRLRGTQRRLVYGTVFLSTGLAFLLPAAMGRIMVLIPIFLALADEVGFARGRRGRDAIMLAVTLGTVVPAFAILPANLPNIVLLGVAETLHGVGIGYTAYLLLFFPVLGLGYALMLAELICRVLPDRVEPRAADAAPPPPWTAAERRLLAILLLALALWATDTLDGVAPGWVALGAGLACLWPGIGVVDTRAFESTTSFGVFFYVAGLLGMVGLIVESGLAAALGQAALAWLPRQPGAPLVDLASLIALASGVGLLTTHPGVPAVLGPLAAPIAKATGLPILSVLLTQIVGFSTILLPYQSAPVLVALQLSGVPLGRATRLCVTLGVLTLLMLMPLQLLWWQWLGLSG